MKELIEKGESQNLEFKSKVDKSLGKAICSFANTTDGVILVGVSDDKRIIGCSEKDEQKIASIAHTCKPSVYPKIEKTKIDGRTIFVVDVKKSGSLHSYKNIAYKRIGSNDEPVSPEEVVELAKSAGKIRFDYQICEEASLEDIDREKVKWYLEKRAEIRGIAIPKTPFEQILINLGVVAKKDGKLIPTNAGILFFAKNPQKFIPYSELKIARFKGSSMVEFIDRAELQGTLSELVDEAEKFVKRNTRRATKIVEFEQVNIAEYPYEAIREAITNAVTHRDYFFSGASVRVMVFDDRIEVESPGKLPEGVTLKNLEGSHVLRNEKIGNLLYDIGYIEKWGTGIRRMKDSMKAHGLEEPGFEEEEKFFKVTFYGPGEKILELIKPRNRVNLKELGLNDRQIEALRLMVNEGKEFTNKKYREMFSVSRKTALRDLSDLIDKDLIRKEGVRRWAKFVAK